ncbi:MAG: phosphoribosyltransferase domain-containing protein [Clostridium sp.]
MAKNHYCGIITGIYTVYTLGHGKGEIKMSIDIKVKENIYNFNIDDLVCLGHRINNSKRNFLFISKVLGKHIEVKPGVCKEIGFSLASLIYGKKQDEKPYKTKEDICILGFAETATGLGMAVAAAIEGSYYITTTREDIIGVNSIINFEEEHSHATSHKCFALESNRLINADRIIIVDDEITTGKSIINIIKELKRITNVKKFTVLSILDWRNQENIDRLNKVACEECLLITVLSLISGDIKINDSRIYIDNNEELIEEKTKVLELKCLERVKIPTALKPTGESYLSHSGRFGVDFKEIEKLEEKCREVALKIQEKIGENEKILVLGHGENIYIPSRVASYLNAEVYFKSTTRSPIFCDDIEGYPIKQKNVFYHNGVKYYFYNKDEIEKKYHRVILITEDDLNVKLTNNIIIVKI